MSGGISHPVLRIAEMRALWRTIAVDFSATDAVWRNVFRSSGGKRFGTQMTTKHLFLDESGECSFSQRSTFKHFVITILSVDDPQAIQIKRQLRRNFARLVRRGWKKTKEVKAADLFRDSRFAAGAVVEVLNALTTITSLEVSYIVVNKRKIDHQPFRQAPYGISYNYFTGVLLSELVFEDEFRRIRLNYDIRNKETHKNKHFKEHLETKIIGTALEKDTPIELSIHGFDSSCCYGLSAVDFFSWGIFRKFEHTDARFYDLFAHRLKRRREWYITK
jgi:hypothetical protein